MLLYGPPGCGKTLLARATATECGLPFSNVRIEEILDPFIGVSEHNLHDVFEQARRASPCVLFLDELDAIGFAVHVPHYLGQTEFADAAVLGLERVRAATGLDLDLRELAATAGLNRAEISRQIEESDEITAVVRALEQQYDTFLEGRQQRNLLATDLSDLPTADEIGAEFEAFLKDVTEDDEQ